MSEGHLGRILVNQVLEQEVSVSQYLQSSKHYSNFKPLNMFYLFIYFLCVCMCACVCMHMYIKVYLQSEILLWLSIYSFYYMGGA